MKKLFHIATTAVVSTAFMGGLAMADPGCDAAITGTGDGSNNVVSCTDINNITVTCLNNIWTGNVNTQDGESGSGSIKYNTTSGSVLTGQVVNTNGQNVTIGSGCDGVAAPGGVGATHAPNPGGGLGAANGPAVLPNTATDGLLNIAIVSLLSASAAFVVTRMGVSALRRLKLR